MSPGIATDQTPPPNAPSNDPDSEHWGIATPHIPPPSIRRSQFENPRGRGIATVATPIPNAPGSSVTCPLGGGTARGDEVVLSRRQLTDPPVFYNDPHFTRDGSSIVCKATVPRRQIRDFTVEIDRKGSVTLTGERTTVPDDSGGNDPLAISATRLGGVFWVAYNRVRDDAEIFVAPIRPPFGGGLVGHPVSDVDRPDPAKQGILWGGDVEWLYSERGSRNDLIRSHFTVSSETGVIEQLVIDRDKGNSIETTSENGSACPVLDREHFNFGRLIITAILPGGGAFAKTIALVRIKETFGPMDFGVGEIADAKIELPFPELGFSGQPEWSPNGFMYAFNVTNNIKNPLFGSQLYVAVYDPDAASDETVQCFQLTSRKTAQDETSRSGIRWSEDGRYILYSRAENGANGTPGSIYVIDVLRALRNFSRPFGATPPSTCTDLSPGVAEFRISQEGDFFATGAFWRPTKRQHRSIVYGLSPMVRDESQLWEAILDLD